MYNVIAVENKRIKNTVRNVGNQVTSTGSVRCTQYYYVKPMISELQYYSACHRHEKKKNDLEVKAEDEKDSEEASSSRNYLKNTKPRYTFNRVSKITPHYLTININGQNMPLQLDTASKVTIVSL